MERELCLILDVEGFIRLVLKKGTASEIDQYTSRYFEEVDDIKQRYKKEIEEFLEEYKEKLQNSTNPNYRGRLAVVIPEKVGQGYTEYQRSVLLKKHIVIFNEYIKHKPVMVQFVSSYGKKYSESFLFSIYAKWEKNNTKTKINEWVRELKEDKEVYYDTVRNFLKNYEKLRCPSSESAIRLNIPSIDDFYAEYKNKKSARLKSKIEKVVPIKLQSSKHEVVSDSVIYDDEEQFHTISESKYTQDELIQFDLDDNADYEDGFIPDGLGGNGKKFK